jgi:acyl-CoA synthetase (AMP-forming)/AMP-acid ligase II
VIRSKFPDVEIPDLSLTDFVLAGAVGRGDRPALIDAHSGRTITYAQLAESVQAVAAGLADRALAGARCSLTTLRTCPSTRSPSMRSRRSVA